MPVYEYKCNACGKEFEYQQRMADPDKTDCEACGKSALERLISRTAFQLKGSGWYKDLYASSKPSESKASDTPAASTSSDTASTPAAAPAASSSSDSSSSSGSTGSSSGSSGGGSTTGGGSSSSKAAASAS